MATTVNQPIYGAVTSVDKASEYRIYFAKKLLEHQVDKLQLYQYAYPAEIPTGQGSKDDEDVPGSPSINRQRHHPH
jgi:hypothetical protein